MMKLVTEEIDVAEIYSPPRLAVTAKELELKAGWSLDLTTKDTPEIPWILVSMRCDKGQPPKSRGTSRW